MNCLNKLLLQDSVKTKVGIGTCNTTKINMEVLLTLVATLEAALVS